MPFGDPNLLMSFANLMGPKLGNNETLSQSNTCGFMPRTSELK